MEMNKVFKTCDECGGFGEIEDPDNIEKEIVCDHCYGERGDYITIGDKGTMITDVREKQNNFSKSQVMHIKRLGHRTSDNWYPHYYHNDIKLVNILNDRELIVVLGDNGRNKFKINIDDFYQ